MVLGFRFFVSDVSGVALVLFGPLHVALGPNHKMVFYSSFLLETRLKSESLHTFDDLLRFQFQKVMT